ncbi:MAG: bile acid:sodium symporter family protein, partial [Alistipes sp.]|nr:bile acid:sodium symporter family protein [Alistipes sp.]
GMILVASCPGGNISNFMSSLSKGNVELSVSMTAITTVFAPLVTPLNFWLWGTLYSRFASLRNDIPTLEIPFIDMLYQILLILGVPIILGMVFSHYLPKAAAKIMKPLQVLSILLFLGMVIVSLKQVLTALDPSIYWSILVIFTFVILHNATALGTGYLGATLMRVPPIDRRSLTIEVGIQNSGLGLTLLFNPAIFPPEVWSHNGGMVLITALWGVWHIVSGLIVASTFRRSKLV